MHLMHTNIDLHDVQPRQGSGEGGQWARIGAWGTGAGALPCTCAIEAINGLDMYCSRVLQHVVDKTSALATFRALVDSVIDIFANVATYCVVVLWCVVGGC